MPYTYRLAFFAHNDEIKNQFDKVDDAVSAMTNGNNGKAAI